MTDRDMVCACEDVSVDDIAAAMDRGFIDAESIKRYTGLATGICQGKACLPRLAAVVRARTRHTTPQVMRPTTPRPPVSPIRLGHLADATLPPVFPGPHAPLLFSPKVPRYRPPMEVHGSLPKRASVVIVGGGVMGLATAYHLGLCGVKDVLVLERDYLNAGASGRNGGGIRMQWSTAAMIDLMKESIGTCRTLARELGINIWLRQGGYLFLARRDADMETASARVALQNSMGVRTRLMTPADCARLVPGLTVNDVLGATFNPDDGVIFPWPFLYGYAQRARALGAHIESFTAVENIATANGRICGVQTSRGYVACDRVINAAAAWSHEISAMVGIQAKNYPSRHEIMVTESLKPCVGPLVTEMDSGLYFSQSLRGEIVAGMGDPEEPPGLQMRSSLRFAKRISQALCQRYKPLTQVQFVRQWAGCYDVSPDGNPIVGEEPTVPGFFQLNGFVGHGFMLAPALTRRVARLLARGQSDSCFDVFTPRRFAPGAKPVPHETMIIG